MGKSSVSLCQRHKPYWQFIKSSSFVNKLLCNLCCSERWSDDFWLEQHVFGQLLVGIWHSTSSSWSDMWLNWCFQGIVVWWSVFVRKTVQWPVNCHAWRMPCEQTNLISICSTSFPVNMFSTVCLWRMATSKNVSLELKSFDRLSFQHNVSSDYVHLVKKLFSVKRSHQHWWLVILTKSDKPCAVSVKKRCTGWDLCMVRKCVCSMEHWYIKVLI